MRHRPKHRLATIALLVGAAIAAFLLFADRRAGTVGGVRLGAQRGVLPRLAPGPALGVVSQTAIDVRLGGVIRDTGGEPIAGARVCAVCANCYLGPEGSSPPCAQTDASGAYALGDLAIGDYRLAAGAAGYKPGMVHAGAVLHVGPKGLRADGLDGVLESGGALVTGSVLDGTGGPVAGAIVEAHFQPDGAISSQRALQTTVADENGAFSIAVLPGGVRLMSRADGYAPGDIYTSAPATNVRLLMTPSSEISGHVVTAREGRPVANVRVTAEQRGPEQFAISDDQGAFRITSLSPGTFYLTASAKGWFGEHSGSVTLGIGERVNDVLVHVVPGANVHGAVLIGEQACPTGNVMLAPAPGLSLPSFTAHADGEGKVKFEAVPAGLYRSSVECEDYEPQPGPEIEVHTLDLAGVIWRFEQTAEVTVVAKTTGGMTAESTWIDFQRVAGPGEAPAGGSRANWTDKKGEVHFKGVAAGAYRISGPDITQTVSVEVKKGVNRFEVALDARGYIDVYVKRPNGEPNDDVDMLALRKDGKEELADAHRYDTGRYRIGPVGAGPHYVQLRDGVNPAARSAEMQVRAGAVTTIEMIYGGQQGKITGRVLEASGTPLANVWVSAEASDSASDMITQNMAYEARAKQHRVYTNALGRFEIDGVDPRGSFSVIVTRRSGGEERRAGVAAGQHVEVVLPATATLSGVALAPDGSPLRNFRLSIINATTKQSIAPLFGPETSGAWRVQEITAGEVEVGVSTWNGAHGSAVVKVSPGQQLSGIAIKIAPPEAAQLARQTEVPN